MFWNNFVTLCNGKGISPNCACAELGFSTAIATKWKNGAVPRDTTLKKIADYFNVSVDYLLGKTEVSEADNANALLSSQEAELLKMFRQLNELQKAKLLISAEELLNK